MTGLPAMGPALPENSKIARTRAEVDQRLLELCVLDKASGWQRCDRPPARHGICDHHLRQMQAASAA